MPVETIHDQALAAMVVQMTAVAQIEEIILFGSRARGEADELSDYDLLVVVSDKCYYRDLALDLRTAVEDVPASKDIVVARRSTIVRRGHISGLIYKEALAEGRQIYAAA